MEKIELPIEIEKKDMISPKSPDIQWLGKMLIIIFFILIIFIGTLYIFNLLIAKYLPYEKEKELFGNLINYSDLKYREFDWKKLNHKIDNIEKYNIYINDSLEKNAFASIGGNILINKGLIENLKWEEELLFIIGHEIGHIENRDVLKSIFKEFPIIFLAKLLGIELNFNTQSIINFAKTYYDRETELMADNKGAQIINELGLNLNCSINFFTEDIIKDYSFTNFFGTHPINEERIKNLENQTLHKEKECNFLDYNL